MASQYIYIFTSYADIKPKIYERVYLDIPEFYVPEKKEDCIKLVRDFYCIPHLYFEIEEEPGTNGRTTIFPPIVFVDKDLSNQQLILTYAHELTHIKYQTVNETFVTFMTFKALYESDNETLHGCGLTLAWRVLYGGYAWTDYDCGIYILEYFESI